MSEEIMEMDRNKLSLAEAMRNSVKVKTKLKNQEHYCINSSQSDLNLNNHNLTNTEYNYGATYVTAQEHHQATTTVKDLQCTSNTIDKINYYYYSKIYQKCDIRKKFQPYLLPSRILALIKTTIVMLIICTRIAPIAAGSSHYSSGASYNKDVFNAKEPSFIKTPYMVEGSPGQTVILSCLVSNLASRRVSWIRSSDLQILTSGSVLFTSDNRFSIDHPYGGPDSWSLLIKDVRPGDSGRYECQINTEPKKKIYVSLVVREVQQSDMPFGGTIIDGPREQVVKIGTVVVFNCSAKHHYDFTSGSAERQVQVIWSKDGKSIVLFEKGGINIHTEFRPQTVTSRLTLIAADRDDNGAYSCTVPSSGTDTVMLLIDEGEAQAAIVSKAINHRSAGEISHFVLIFWFLYVHIRLKIT